MNEYERDQAEKLRRRLAGIAVRQAKTVAVASGKGGVGKSNFVVNFSLALSKQRKKVLIFDLDIGMGNVDVLLGQTSKNSLLDMFYKNRTIDDVIEDGPDSISYIAGGTGLSDLFEMDTHQFEFFLSQLNDVLYRYDYILFDMGAGITEESSRFLFAADECIVIATPEPTALTDAYSLIKYLVSRKYSISIRVLVNRATSQKIGRQTLQRLEMVVERFLNKKVKPFGILPEDKVVFQSVIEQSPYLIHKPKSSVSSALQQLAQSYTVDNISEEPDGSVSFISKLRKIFRER
ncbi:MinD/ParA family protein [Sediminibacillus massiliensis]|uniref:MinD/ParA family protein n=1 Tax=Sediminibacillus massiliensis TaxID=1926277 RepID=UPI000988936F|nr:MinD/ParA family protein [Sediminibacillus massiliensis]